VHPELETWVERQKPQTQDKFRKVNAVVLSDTNFWKNLDMCSRIFEPALQALCVNDDMKGGTPAILYDLCLGLDKLYSEPIDGLPEPTRRNLHALFIERTQFASSWTKHSAAWNITNLRERTFSKSSRLFLK
jgi:hypothetical protein